jgi:small subunit ribosomal protein S5
MATEEEEKDPTAEAPKEAAAETATDAADTEAAPAAKAEAEAPAAEEPKADAAGTEAAPAAKAEAEAPAEEPKAEAAADGDGDEAGTTASAARVMKAKKQFENLQAVDEEPELMEKVVFINRCAKVVKGGRRFSFSALVVAGDQKGKVGYGFGKANEVAECIRKASESSKGEMVEVARDGNTIPHQVIGKFGGGCVLLRPASEGTGIIAGGGVRAVIEAAGIKNVLAKSLGSNNHANVVKATIAALTSLRTRDEVFALRGKKIRDKAAL